MGPLGIFGSSWLFLIPEGPLGSKLAFPGLSRRSQEEPGGARKSQEKPGKARRSRKKAGEAKGQTTKGILS